jgi:hypothetical protein
VNTQVSIGGVQQALQVVEGKHLVHSQGAEDAETDALMDQGIEVGQRRLMLACRDCVSLT